MVIVYRSVKLINLIYCQFNVIIRASYCDEAEYQQLLLLLSITDRHGYQLIVRNIQNVSPIQYHVWEPHISLRFIFVPKLQQQLSSCDKRLFEAFCRHNDQIIFLVSAVASVATTAAITITITTTVDMGAAPLLVQKKAFVMMVPLMVEQLSLFVRKLNCY